jgi:hypothetical protein
MLEHRNEVVEIPPTSSDDIFEIWSFHWQKQGMWPLFVPARPQCAGFPVGAGARHCVASRRRVMQITTKLTLVGHTRIVK